LISSEAVTAKLIVCCPSEPHGTGVKSKAWSAYGGRICDTTATAFGHTCFGKECSYPSRITDVSPAAIPRSPGACSAAQGTAAAFKGFTVRFACSSKETCGFAWLQSQASEEPVRKDVHCYSSSDATGFPKAAAEVAVLSSAVTHTASDTTETGTSSISATWLADATGAKALHGEPHVTVRLRTSSSEHDRQADCSASNEASYFVGASESPSFSDSLFQRSFPCQADRRSESNAWTFTLRPRQCQEKDFYVTENNS